MAIKNVNTYEFTEDTVIVSTHGTNPGKFIIDKADFPAIQGKRYHIFSNAARKPSVARFVKGKTRVSLVHDLFCENAALPAKVRYRDGNPLNLRRGNVVICESRPRDSVLSGTKMRQRTYGVTYQAYVRADGKEVCLGYFDTERQAVYAVLVAKSIIPNIAADPKLDMRRQVFTHSMAPAEKERVRSIVMATIPPAYLGDNVRRGSKHAE